MGLDAAHLFAVQELVVHVEQVLVHERVVGVDLAVELAGLVGLVRLGSEGGRQARLGQGRIAGEDEDQSVDLGAGIGLHPVRQVLAAQVGHVDALAGHVIGPAVVAALDGAALDHPVGQRHLAVGAAILQGEQLAVLAAHHGDGLAGETPRQHLAGLELFRPGDRIPEVRMAIDAPQIDPRVFVQGELHVHRMTIRALRRPPSRTPPSLGKANRRASLKKRRIGQMFEFVAL